MDFNRGEHGDLFRPWGFQPGHLASGRKLLLALERALPGSRHRDTGCSIARASSSGRRCNTAGTAPMAASCTTFGRARCFGDGVAICDADKYFWVQAETIAAAAALAERTVEGGYWDWYDRHLGLRLGALVDHEHGAWYRILDARTTASVDDEKSPAGKVDYHTLGACLEALDALTR